MKLTGTVWNATTAYFFRGNRYTRYDISNDAADTSFCRNLSTNWKGMTGSFAADLDAAVIWPTGYAYFFKGAGYVKYNIDPKNEGVLAGYPRPISNGWKTLPKSNTPGLDFTRDLDAAVAWPTGFAYFFKGSNYVKYNMDPKNEGALAGYPRPIAANWKTLPASPDPALDFTRDLDAVIAWPRGYAYFFKGRNYVKYNLDPNNEGALPNYPRPIYDNWPHLAASFPDGLDENILITSTPYWENTCRAIEPSPAQPLGAILLSPGELPGQPGYPYVSRILSRPIFNAQNGIDYMTGTVETQLPGADTLGGHTDNQLARSKNGEILALRSVFDSTMIANETTWQLRLQSDYRGDVTPKKGGRGSIALWALPASSAWTLRSVIDPYTVGGGQYGFPAPLSCSGILVNDLKDQCPDPAKPKWICPGTDRNELYACPFTGYVYVTAKFGSGPYADATVKSDLVNRSVLLLCSRDAGKTWDVVKDTFA